MKTAWHDIWGSARGPVRRLSPQVRIICGAGVFAGCMITPAIQPLGVAAVLTSLFAWLILVRPPGRVLRGSLLFGLLLFSPYFLLMPLLHEPAAADAWLAAAAVPWTVFFRGLCGMLATIATATTLSASDLRRGLDRLPLPRALTAVLIQIVQQSAALLSETRRISAAIAVRGGSTGLRTAVRVVGSVPRVWLPRVVDRAERVSAAMELRGYCQRDLVDREPGGLAWMDAGAIALALAVVGGAVALRLWGVRG